MMEGETSKTSYKLIEYNNTLYQIPIRTIGEEQVVLFSDVQLILPNATALLSNSKLIPFQLDPNNQYTELIPKREVKELFNSFFISRVVSLDYLLP